MKTGINLPGKNFDVLVLHQSWLQSEDAVCNRIHTAENLMKSQMFASWRHFYAIWSTSYGALKCQTLHTGDFRGASAV